MSFMGMLMIDNLAGFRVVGMRTIMGMRVVMIVIMRVRVTVVRLDQGIGGPIVAGASAIFTHGILHSCCEGL